MSNESQVAAYARNAAGIWLPVRADNAGNLYATVTNPTPTAVDAATQGGGATVLEADALGFVWDTVRQVYVRKFVDASAADTFTSVNGMTASGAVVYTPPAGQLVDLRGYQIELPNTLAKGAGGPLTIQLAIGGVPLPTSHVFYVPAIAGTSMGSQWYPITLPVGFAGAANQAVTILLTGGPVNVPGIGITLFMRVF